MAPGLDPDFVFSQHSLADFEECPRRFYLRYVARQAWPLVETGPGGLSAVAYQEYLRRGKALHRWIERDQLGLPAGAEPDSGDAELSVWWQRYREADLSALPPQRTPELELSASVGAARVYARFDLLATGEDGQAVIVDWKTLRGARPPRPEWLRQRLQTRVYLYVLAAAGAPFNGGRPFDPAEISMRYWLANFPEQPWVEARYSRAEFEADGRRLARLVEGILALQGENAFEKTDRLEACAYCSYRTLCEREGAIDAAAYIDEESAADDGDPPALEY